MKGVVSAAREVVYGSVAARDEHDTAGWHPEQPARLRAVDDAIASLRLGEALRPLQPREATLDELGRVHDRAYLDALTSLADLGGGELDPDTLVAAGSWRTAALSAGLGLVAIDELRKGCAGAAFVAPRPPGHHATRTHGMGFCLLNNVAVAAAALVDEGERVAIVDWDVHHGNGTQAIFWDDPRVLYVSTHESPAYPGTGDAREVGGPHALNTTVNVPLPAGATGDVVLRAVDDIAAEVIDAFAPEWMLVSAGFDAHRDDPLADLACSAGDFAALAQRVLDLAPPQRTLLFLEGGYDLRALSVSVAATVAALAGLPLPTEPETAGGPGMDAVDRARHRRTDELDVMA